MIQLVEVGAALIERARAVDRLSIAVVGTGKNVGKTVTVAALCAALARARNVFGLTSIGHDGESLDVLEAVVKPRLFLPPGTLIATAQALLPRYPALEILAITEERSALGPIVLARVRTPGFYEIAGPPSVDALRRVVRKLVCLGASWVVLDGAVDRIAALRDGEDAIVIATGAAGGPTPEHVVEEVRALTARLRLPPFDPSQPFLRIGGALRADEAIRLWRRGERRQIVVHDATRIVFGGRAFLSVAANLDLRCERALHPVAVTVASIGPGRNFEPFDFMHAVAVAAKLPTFDVFAQGGV